MRFFGQKDTAKRDDDNDDGGGDDSGIKSTNNDNHTKTSHTQSAEDILKDDLTSEVENLQNEFRQKQNELDTVTQKIQTVKTEYDTIVSNLMLVKKELNQKRMQVDTARREHLEILDKIKKADQHIKSSKQKDDISEKSLSKTRRQLQDAAKEYDEIKKTIVQAQAALDDIQNQHAQTQRDLQDTKSASGLRDPTQISAGVNGDGGGGGGSRSSSDDTEHEGGPVPAKGAGDNKSTAGIIEAASAIVGSLKSQLITTQNELEAVRSLLSEERTEHEKTRQELLKLKNTMDPTHAGTL